MMSTSLAASDPPCGIRLFVGEMGSATAAFIEALNSAIAVSESNATGLPSQLPVEL
jgi:hypothetical protein